MAIVSLLVSTSFAKQIENLLIPYPESSSDSKPLEITNVNEIIHCNDKTCTSLTFQEKVGYNFDQEIVISEFPHVQFINLQCFSFYNASELTISNLPELQVITVEAFSFISAEFVLISGMNSFPYLIWTFLNFILFIVVEIHLFMLMNSFLKVYFYSLSLLFELPMLTTIDIGFSCFSSTIQLELSGILFCS